MWDAWIKKEAHREGETKEAIIEIWTKATKRAHESCHSASGWTTSVWSGEEKKER